MFTIIVHSARVPLRNLIRFSLFHSSKAELLIKHREWMQKEMHQQFYFKETGIVLRHAVS